MIEHLFLIFMLTLFGLACLLLLLFCIQINREDKE